MKRYKQFTTYNVDVAIALRSQTLIDILGRGVHPDDADKRVTLRESITMCKDNAFMWGIGGENFYSVFGQWHQKCGFSRMYNRKAWKKFSHDCRKNAREERLWQEQNDRQADAGPHGYTY